MDWGAYRQWAGIVRDFWLCLAPYLAVVETLFQLFVTLAPLCRLVYARRWGQSSLAV